MVYPQNNHFGVSTFTETPILLHPIVSSCSAEQVQVEVPALSASGNETKQACQPRGIPAADVLFKS